MFSLREALAREQVLGQALGVAALDKEHRPGHPALGGAGRGGAWLPGTEGLGTELQLLMEAKRCSSRGDCVVREEPGLWDGDGG